MKSRFENSALLLVDIQNDFCPGGALSVSEGDQIIDIVNRLIPEFPLVVSGIDWHPANHISFKQQGGPWPPHCVQGTPGAELHTRLNQAEIDLYFRKADTVERDAYSEFEGRDKAGRSLDEVLKTRNIERLYVAGLATDYCVRATVLDGLKLGYDVYVITDGVRAVNVHPDDGAKALKEMSQNGAHLLTGRGMLEDTEAAGATGG